MKCNQPGLGFELVSPCPIPTTITITPRAPPFGYHLAISLSTQKYHFTSCFWVRLGGRLKYCNKVSGVLFCDCFWLLSFFFFSSDWNSRLYHYLVFVSSNFWKFGGIILLKVWKFGEHNFIECLKVWGHNYFKGLKVWEHNFIQGLKIFWWGDIILLKVWKFSSIISLKVWKFGEHHLFEGLKVWWANFYWGSETLRGMILLKVWKFGGIILMMVWKLEGHDFIDGLII